MINHHESVCPSCGYCPACGRKNAAPYNPWYQPTWNPYIGPSQPTIRPWWSGNTGGSITIGGTANLPTETIKITY